MFAKGNGGSFKGFALTRHEQYKVLPKLIGLGWVSENFTMKKYRSLTKGYLSVSTHIESYHLMDLKSFKGFLIASLEASQLRSFHRRQAGRAKEYSHRDRSFVRKDWVRSGNQHELFYVEKIGTDTYRGRVFNNSICSLMNISKSTVSSWRKGSQNYYNYKTVSSPHPFIMGRESDKMYRRKDLMYCTKDMFITSYIDIFTNRYICI